MSEEEKKAIANFKYWIDTNTEKGVCYLPDYICAKVLNLIEKLQKENEELKETLKCTQNSWYEDTQKIEEMKKQIDLDNECEIALNSKVMDLEKEIEELEKELYNQKIALNSLYVVCREFLHNNIKNNQIMVSVEEPHLFYSKANDETVSNFKCVEIDLSDYKILQEFHKRLNEVEQQLKGGLD